MIKEPIGTWTRNSRNQNQTHTHTLDTKIYSDSTTKWAYIHCEREEKCFAIRVFSRYKVSQKVLLNHSMFRSNHEGIYITNRGSRKTLHQSAAVFWVCCEEAQNFPSWITTFNNLSNPWWPRVMPLQDLIHKTSHIPVVLSKWCMCCITCTTYLFNRCYKNVIELLELLQLTCRQLSTDMSCAISEYIWLIACVLKFKFELHL